MALPTERKQAINYSALLQIRIDVEPRAAARHAAVDARRIVNLSGSPCNVHVPANDFCRLIQNTASARTIASNLTTQLNAKCSPLPVFSAPPSFLQSEK